MAVPGTGILKGLWTTLKHAIKWDVVTVQYPDQRKPGRTLSSSHPTPSARTISPATAITVWPTP